MAGPVIPHINLLCLNEKDTAAFQTACTTYSLPTNISSGSITHHNHSMSTLHTSDTAPRGFDLVVSPANSHFLLDGGFDDAISRQFSPAQDYYALTRHAQSTLYQRWRGYAPPGTCTIVSIPASFAETSRQGGARWGCKWLALCPTMRVPMDVSQCDAEVVYRCVWSLLCEIERHNRGKREEGKEGEMVRSLLMTPLATGVGRVSREKWAAQLVLAIKHWSESVEKAVEWGQVGWNLAERVAEEVERTYEL
ncbi:macro domain-like protein [Polychaeton citri CBS 116435]|uniref:Macro domain-like protein n=1 Tax=Polychaeton citri CBS 116435 TaxID=1314669 RepID=A0A9P4Q195_9PEZI|nr:macro domain-like protein [Polychaeton citri CBS 116435]